MTIREIEKQKNKFMLWKIIPFDREKVKLLLSQPLPIYLIYEIQQVMMEQHMDASFQGIMSQNDWEVLF